MEDQTTIVELCIADIDDEQTEESILIYIATVLTDFWNGWN